MDVFCPIKHLRSATLSSSWGWCVLNKTIASENNCFTSENEQCCRLTGDVFSRVFTLSVLVTTGSYQYEKIAAEWVCITAALPLHSAVCLALCLITLAIWVILSVCICACHSCDTRWHLSDMYAKPTADSGDMKCLCCVLSHLVSCVSAVSARGHGGDSLEAKCV